MERQLRKIAQSNGADLFGVCDLAGLNLPARGGWARGIAFGIAVDPAILRRIGPEAFYEYYGEYTRLNQRLDAIAEALAAALARAGHSAAAQTTAYIKRQRQSAKGPDGYGSAALPHKTIAALAGLGWIGKNALLVTERFGSGLRLGSVLTSAPLAARAASYSCRCGGCEICSSACPGGALKNTSWRPGVERGALLDYAACVSATNRRGSALGLTDAACGLCMARCPYTRRYVEGATREGR